MAKMSRTDALIEWTRDHPLVLVGVMLFYAVVLTLSWYLAQLIASTPSSPFIYDI